MGFRTISAEYPLILASASPRRKRLLKQLSIPFESRASRITEGEVNRHPMAASRRLAEKKALQVYAGAGGFWILGADTVVTLGGRSFGKPKDAEDARRMLSELSGREHRVVTGFCLLDPSGQPAHTEAVATRVRLKKMTREEIGAYLETGEPFGKAGGYAVQGIGAFMVEMINGSYTNVVGLPLHELTRALVSVKALTRFP